MRRGLILAGSAVAGTALLGLGLVARGTAADRWHGITIGRAPVGPVQQDPTGVPGDPHLFAFANPPGFPWQAVTARLNRDGRVMALTFTTDCCEQVRESDISLSEEEEAALARKEAAVPDQFVAGRAPPPVMWDWTVHPRTISVRDMRRYGRAAIAEVSEQLGTPTALERASSGGQLGVPSSLSDGEVLHVRWNISASRGTGDAIALLDADAERVCLSVVAPDVPHPPLESACRGVAERCLEGWYAPTPLAPASPGGPAITPPPVVAPPRPLGPPCPVPPR